MDRNNVTYNDLILVRDAMKNDIKQPEFINRFYCTEFHMLYDSDIKKLYPNSKKKRIKIARKSNDSYLVRWRGLKFYLLPDTTLNQIQIFNIELRILFALIKNKVFSYCNNETF